MDRLRLTQGLTWKQVAEKLGVGVSMLMLVKTGRRNISKKILFRLEQTEIAVGLRPPTSHKTSSSEPENLDMEIGLKRLRAKLNSLNPQAQKRVLKAVLQILDEAQK
jgi:transcriptional regulator with XRE-family HTH domain